VAQYRFALIINVTRGSAKNSISNIAGTLSHMISDYDASTCDEKRGQTEVKSKAE